MVHTWCMVYSASGHGGMHGAWRHGGMAACATCGWCGRHGACTMRRFVMSASKGHAEAQCALACLLVANRSYTGAKKFTNVKGCFAIMSGEYKGNCNYNEDASAICTPPCGPDHDLGELCLTKSL